jgi:hypothetical protein
MHHAAAPPEPSRQRQLHGMHCAEAHIQTRSGNCIAAGAAIWSLNQTDSDGFPRGCSGREHPPHCHRVHGETLPLGGWSPFLDCGGSWRVRANQTDQTDSERFLSGGRAPFFDCGGSWRVQANQTDQTDSRGLLSGAAGADIRPVASRSVVRRCPATGGVLSLIAK